MTVRATWNGAVLAESDRTVMVEGNQYFPPDSLRRDLLARSDKHTRCPWKGQASYYDIVVGDAVNPAGAWYYPDPLPDAAGIRDHVAFWQGVAVEEVPDRP